MQKNRITTLRTALVGMLVFSITTFIYIQFGKVQGIGEGYTASDVLGQPNFTSYGEDGISVSGLSLHEPSAVEIDTINHRLFVADTENGRVLIYNLDSNDELIDSEADYVLGKSALNTEQNYDLCGTPTQSLLCRPYGLAYDPTNQTLFVSDDSLNRIMIFDVTSITNGENAIGVLGQADFESYGSNTNQSGVQMVRGLDYDTVNDRLFVADTENDRVLVMDFDVENFTNGQNFDMVLGQPNFTNGICGGTNSQNLCLPYDIKYDSINENLYVTDTGYQRVMVFDASVSNLDSYDTAIHVFGQEDFSGNSAMAGNSIPDNYGFESPKSVDYDSQRELLYVGDDYRIYIFDISTLQDYPEASNLLGVSEVLSGDCTTTSMSFCSTEGLAYSQTTQQLYTSSFYHNRVLGFDLSVIENQEPATQIIGQPNYTSSNDRYYNTPNEYGFSEATASFVDTKNRRLFVADSSYLRIMVFELDSNYDLADKNADYVLGVSSFSEYGECPGTPDASVFCGPSSMTYDYENDLLFVSDNYYNRVLVFEVAVGEISNGMEASYVIGQPDFASYDDNVASSQSLTEPAGVAFDNTNRILYVADADNHRVLGYPIDIETLENHPEATMVIGQIDYIEDGSNTTRSTLDYPMSIAVDETNSLLYIADTQNDRVLVHDINLDNFTNGQEASYVIGQTTFNENGCGSPSQDRLCNPSKIALDIRNSVLFVGEDNDYYRVVSFDVRPDNLSNGMSAQAVLGWADFVSEPDYQEIPNNSFIQWTGGLSVNNINGDLFVSSSVYYRVLQYKFVSAINTSLDDGESNEGYSEIITYQDHQADVTGEIIDGSLPEGLSFDEEELTITGTPTETGIYSFTIRLIDDNGANGIFTSQTEFTITIDPELVDNDSDGIPNIVEIQGPNDGDANGDGIQDSTQTEVASFVNPISSNPVVLESSETCSVISNASVVSNSSLNDVDNAFTYPVGMLSFTLLCSSPGLTTTVTQYYYEEDLEVDQIVIRKYNPILREYYIVNDANLQVQNIGGRNVIVAEFEITDGGAYDSDGVTNSVIIDPSGIAVNSAQTPNTGIGGLSGR
ncbi:MAG TPA: putative Ig domain-containing protein [Candidatus Dojkabacteria bacterium]|nr:putative Ig domain-containing protein [Candidatus Dojkabacteria bacterium]